MVRRKRSGRWAGICRTGILVLAFLAFLEKPFEARSGQEDTDLPGEGRLKIGFLDFQANGPWIDPKTLWPMKKALMDETRATCDWQTKDIGEKRGYVELAKEGYRLASDIGARHQVDLLVATHLYLLRGASRPFIHFYLIDASGRKSRQINQNLAFEERRISGILPGYAWGHLWSPAKWENGPTLARALRRKAADLLYQAGQDLLASPRPSPEEEMGRADVPPGYPRPHGLYVNISSPTNGALTTAEQVALQGFAAEGPTAGPALDLLFVLDSSGSLRGVDGPATDPHNARSKGAIRLMEKFPPTASVRFGVVDFDGAASLTAPLSFSRRAAIQAIEALDQTGTTNISLGIDLATTELAGNGRPGAVKVAVLFTDGQQPLRGSHWGEEFDFDPSVMDQAAQKGIVIHVLALGEDTDRLHLQKIAHQTGGRFIPARDSAQLLEAFGQLDPLPAGIEKVILEREDGAYREEVPVFSGHFQRSVRLFPGLNLFRTTAVSRSGRTAVAQVLVIRKPEEERDLWVRERSPETHGITLSPDGSDKKGTPHRLELELMLQPEKP